jgi:mannitol operon transcriptional antiterminator
MEGLTVRQRNLLQILLDAEQPVSMAELAVELRLTPRQVSYCLKQIESWLAERGYRLSSKPGVGVVLDVTSGQRQDLRQVLGIPSPSRYAYVAEQRQPLLALLLLTANEPFILQRLQQLTNVSRSTVLADLEGVEVWFQSQHLHLMRRRNYGFWVEGSEFHRRQALAAWIWGHMPWPNPMVRVSHQEGLRFTLTAAPEAPPIVGQVQAVLRRCDPAQTLRYVAELEAGLGGRFSDDGALFLAIILAIQGYRLGFRHYVKLAAESLDRLRQVPIWSIVEKTGRRLAWTVASEWSPEENGYLSMYVLATPRNERWPGDLETHIAFDTLVQQLMQRVAGAYGLSGLAHDSTLRDGLLLHLIPAYFRRYFDLWLPPMTPAPGARGTRTTEHRLAYELALEVHNHTGVMIPADEVENIAMLLEAAYIRERPAAARQILVVCPSGMATAQLLVARLKARFPYMGAFVVRSLRHLSPYDFDHADLVITTIPLPESLVGHREVIQVHPWLLPEDIHRITQWLHTRSQK